jgi:hypothetical protein
VERPASVGSNSAADHIIVLDAALAQLPAAERTHVVVRTDTGGRVKDFLTRPGVSGEFFRWEGWARGSEVIEAVSRGAEAACSADGG